MATLRCSAMLIAMPVHTTFRWNPYNSWCCTQRGNLDRAALLQHFREAGGNHLVIVRYAPSHDWMNEQVWNEADIDHSQVVWARDAGDGNADLLRYFHDRTIWLLEPDNRPWRITRVHSSSDLLQSAPAVE